MPIEAKGVLSGPLANLRELLASCPAWQAWTNSPDATAALERIHLVDLPPPQEADRYTADELSALRPLAIIDEYEAPRGGHGGDAWSATREGIGVFSDSGKLTLHFEADVASENADDPAAAKLDFMNSVGFAIGDMLALAGGNSGFLSIHRLMRWSAYRRSDEAEEQTMGDRWAVDFIVHWGI